MVPPEGVMETPIPLILLGQLATTTVIHGLQILSGQLAEVMEHLAPPTPLERRAATELISINELLEAGSERQSFVESLNWC